MFQYKAISDPQLPPIAGYVEDEDENGNRSYRPTSAQLAEDNAQVEKKLLKQNSLDNDELMLDLVFRITLLEWGV